MTEWFYGGMSRGFEKPNLTRNPNTCQGFLKKFLRFFRRGSFFLGGSAALYEQKLPGDATLDAAPAAIFLTTDDTDTADKWKTDAH
jgi:hypothetical protein